MQDQILKAFTQISGPLSLRDFCMGTCSGTSKHIVLHFLGLMELAGTLTSTKISRHETVWSLA